MISNFIPFQGDGRLAMQNVERYFWQSRAGLRRPPQLVDLKELARRLRAA